MILAPLSRWAPLLLLVFPGIYLLASRCLLWTQLDRRSARLLTPVLFYILLILPTHLLGLITHSLWPALTIATIPLGLLGYILRFSHPGPIVKSPRLPRSAAMLCLATTLLIAPIVLRHNIYDEESIPGHQSTPAELLNGAGWYPPVYLVQPSLELRYHYGVDLLIATVQATLHVRVDHANAIVEFLAWPVCFLMLWLLGESVIGPGTGSWTAILILLSGGLPFLGQDRPNHSPLLGLFQVNGHWLAPPMIAFFFQRPWCVGIPVWCAAVILTLHCLRQIDRWALAILALCTMALAFSQITLFATFMLAAGIVLPIRYLARRDSATLMTGLTLLFAALLATQTHGFFAHSSGQSLHFTLAHDGVAGNLRDSLLWNLASFGLLPFLALPGLIRSRVPLLLGITGALALVILNTITYAATWDIIKFAAVAALVLGLGSAAFVHRVGSARPVARILTAIAFAAIIAPGMLFAAAHWIGQGDEGFPLIQPYWSERYPLDPNDAAAINWLRIHVKPPENLYRRPEAGYLYAVWGGLPTLWPDGDSPAWGMSSATIVQRQKLRAVPLISALWQQGTRWVVVDSLDRDLRADMEKACALGIATREADFGDVTIYQLLAER